MAWRKSGRIQRPRAWSVTGPYRELVRRLSRCAGSQRRLLAMVERRGQGMGELGATLEEATAFAGWRGPLASEAGQACDRLGNSVPFSGAKEVLA